MKKRGALRGFPGLADRTLLEALIAGVADLLELEALAFGDAAHPGALAAMEQARSTLGAERLADLGRDRGVSRRHALGGRGLRLGRQRRGRRRDVAGGSGGNERLGIVD